MLPYDEALKVWAAKRFKFELARIKAVTLEEVPAEGPQQIGDYTWDSGTEAHLKVYVTYKDSPVGELEYVFEEITKIMYELYEAGAE